MATFRAHFDGKFIVPDEPVDLPADRELTVEVRYRETPAEIGQRIALDHEYDLSQIGTEEFLEDVAAARAASARTVVDTPTDGLGWPFLHASER